MTNAELIEKVTAGAKLSKPDATQALDIFGGVKVETDEGQHAFEV